VSGLDLDAAELAFEASTDGTVGIEEEFSVLDPETLDLAPRYEELRDTAQGDELLSGSIAGELISSEIEIRSDAGRDVAAAIASQREVRARLFAHAQSRGVALGSTGTHPWADYREQQNIDTEHYRRVVDGLRYVARRNNTFSLHVHVGVNGIDRAVRTCDRLRPVLPVLLAAGANSPFLEGLDSGLHSHLPALRDPRRLRKLGGIPRLPGAADRDGLDRREHAGLVVGAPAPGVRHGRGPHLRRAGDGRRVGGARGADRRLRAAGCPRRRRGSAVPRP
jgi:hypothetical protein